ncbi:MAG TPA: dihydrodipicolinate synthase family protein [Candidatus Latescibacteria bacterium]|jgi:4-hydroxy-tetrahydrodipicolinate synthase|nr:dihydrodipicolinate synthase family protein [Candidatus Latescibacterota bacterium]
MSENTQSIRGILPVVHMPYLEDLRIDFDALRREVEYLFDCGAQGLCLALVSDTLRLTAQERMEMPARLVEFAQGRGPVIISVGAESTIQARAFARAAEDGGAGALMAIPPLSQGLAEAQLAEYFEELLEEVSLPIIIQDASSYVGAAMSLSFQAELFRKQGDRILFKPEATPLGPCISALRDLTGGKAKIFEGSGGVLLIDSYRRGVAGTIPGVEVLDGLVALWNACVAGDWDRAYEVYLPICAIATLQMQGGLDGYIVTERHLLHRQGLFPNQIHRGPLSFQLDDETRREIDRLYDRMQAVLRR